MIAQSISTQNENGLKNQNEEDVEDDPQQVVFATKVHSEVVVSVIVEVKTLFTLCWGATSCNGCDEDFNEGRGLDEDDEGGNEKNSQEGEEGQGKEGIVSSVVTDNGNTECTQSDEVETDINCCWEEQQENSKNCIGKRDCHDQNSVRHDWTKEGDNDPDQSKDHSHDREHDVTQVSSFEANLVSSLVSRRWTVAIRVRTTVRSLRTSTSILCSIASCGIGISRTLLSRAAHSLYNIARVAGCWRCVRYL